MEEIKHPEEAALPAEEPVAQGNDRRGTVDTIESLSEEGESINMVRIVETSSSPDNWSPNRE